MSVEELQAKVAEHDPSPNYPQCKCGAVPADSCWQRGYWQALLDEARAALTGPAR
jgi:hypothetical protein